MSAATLVVDESTPDITDALKCAGKLFDNADREISLDVLEEMTADGKYASHWTRQNWWGHIYSHENKFREQIKQSGHVVALYEADSVEELFNYVNSIHGWE